MTIRKARFKDLQQLAPLFNAYRVFYKQVDDLNAAKEFLTKRLKQKDSEILIAISNSEIIGFTQLYPLFSSVSIQRAYVLNDLYVDPAHRKNGVGESLLNAAKELCQQHNAKGLTLETDINNPAKQLYEKLGWKKDTGVLHYTWINN